jgi:hypothetical protein
MITVRQLERLWQARDYGRMIRSCMEMKAENSMRLEAACGRAAPAAAMAVIRLDELSQGHMPFCGQMVRVVLAAQEADGGWGDALTTGLCVRALMCGHGDGPAIERGLGYLASLQKADGTWPRAPIRRLAADAYTTAFILLQLGDDFRFERAVRVGDAVDWLAANGKSLDGETARLWRIIGMRRRLHLGRKHAPEAN